MRVGQDGKNIRMEYRRLGRTGLRVSVIGLGGLFVTNEGREAGLRLVERALELSINIFDTAPSYRLGGKYYSQEILGEALEGVEEKHFISTKIGPSPLFDEARYDYDSIMRQLEHNMKQLRRGYIDILHIHDPDRYGDRTNPGNYHPVFGKGMALETLKELKREAVIGAIGLGSLWMDYQAYCVDSGEFDVVLTFNRYGLIWRDAQFQVFPFCRRHDVGVLQGTPFHQGVLVKPRPEWIENPPEWMSAEEHNRYRRLLDIQKRSGLPMTELALRFILQNEMITTVLVGASNVEELEMNVECAEKGPLPEDIYAEVESLGILHRDPRRYI